MWATRCGRGCDQEDTEEGGSDNLSHGDTVRTLRALCFLASNDKSHEDMTQQVYPTLVVLLPHLLSVLTEVAAADDKKDSGQAKGEAAAGGEGCRWLCPGVWLVWPRVWQACVCPSALCPLCLPPPPPVFVRITYTHCECLFC